MLKGFYAAVFALVVVSIYAVAAPGPGPVDLNVDVTGAIKVPVTINGRGPFMFLLDTGANRSTVGSILAARLNLPTVAKAMMVTPTGDETQPVVRIDSMSIGAVRKAELLASEVPSSRLQAVVPDIEGIIGQDFLSTSNYTIDYRKKRLTWAIDRSSGSNESRLSLVKEEGRFLVELPQADRTVWFVPDSGAEGFVIFERNGVAPLALDTVARSATLVTVTGSEDARPTVLRQLQVGRTTMKDQPAILVRRNEPNAPKGDGLLPLHLFASVSFNFADGYIVIIAGGHE